jgi:hypothetical protein
MSNSRQMRSLIAALVLLAGCNDRPLRPADPCVSSTAILRALATTENHCASDADCAVVFLPGEVPDLGDCVLPVAAKDESVSASVVDELGKLGCLGNGPPGCPLHIDAHCIERMCRF